MELWKLNTIFKLFLLAISASFLASAVFHYTLILHFLPLILAIGVAIYASMIVNPSLRARPRHIYVLGTLLISTALASTVVAVGYISLSTINSCSQAGPAPLDWTGTVILDVERHPYLDAGVTYQFSSSLLSGPGYRLRITQDPFTTPVLHYATINPTSSSDVWNFSPATCGKYWIELLNLGFGSQVSDYHVTVVAIPG